MAAFESRPNLRLLQDDVVTAEIQELEGKQNSKLNSWFKEQSPQKTKSQAQNQTVSQGEK